MAKHEIKYGDTLWAISRKATGRGINYKLIAELNNIEDPNNVPIGTELYIPDKNTNRVSTKDLEEGSGFIEMDEYSPDYDYAIKGDSVYYRMKGTDVWSDISDAPGIKDMFRDYIAEEVSQKEPAQPAPTVPDSATLGNAAPYANMTRTQSASPVETSDEDSLFDQIMYYGNLAVNGLRRAFLKRFGDDDRASSLEVPDEPEINPLDVSFTGDTVRVNDRRYFLPESLNINNARFGYRNRGDFSEREGIGAITTFNPFRPKSEINSKKGFYIGVSGDGKFKYGDISKFDDTDMISRVYVNRVKSFDTNDDGSLRFKEAGRGNQGRYMPVVNVIEGGREVKGSLNFLTGKDHRTDTYGDITGGRVLLITDDGRIRLVSGSIDDVKKEFERVKELSGQDALNVVVLDNGTYSRGLRTYDNRMTEGDLRSYDAQNTSGGNFLFIQDLMETNNIAKMRQGGTVSPLIVQTFNPDAFAEAMLSMNRVGDGKGRKVDTKNMEKIYYGLISRGVNGNQLKALMGAIAEESGGDPYIESSGKNYRGLSQWSKERLTDEEFKKIKEMSVDDAIDYELDKLIDGLNATSGSDSFTHGGKGSGYDTGAQAMNAFWNQNGTLESVVHALNNGYIRPGDREGTTENRIRVARLLNNEGVLTDNNAPEEFRPIIEDPFFGYYKADGGPTSDEYRDMFRDLYKQDIERIQNGQRAVFFGHLNDEPLENVYPEFDLIFNPTKVISPKGNYGNAVGFSAEDAWKVLDKATDIQELIIRVPYNLGRMLNEFVSDMSTKGAKKLINMAPEKYRDTLTKIGRYVKKRPKLTTSFLTSFFYDDITGRNKENGLTKEGQTQESFNDAFRKAKEEGKKRFTWNGKEYTTETRPDGGPINEGMYVAARDATSVGQPAPNPNARGISSVYQPIDLTEIVAGGIPIVGDVMDARDLYSSIRDRDAVGALFASVGFLPLVGGAAKSALRMRYTPEVLRKRVTYGFDTPEEAARMMGVAEDKLGNTINLLSENINELPDEISEEAVANIRSQVEKFKEWARESNIPAVRESDKAFNLSRPFDPKHPIENQKVFDLDYGRIKKFAKKYGYDIPNKSDIKSDLELDDLYQRIIRQHRTFVRGVRADSEQEAIEYLFDLAPNTGAGRYGLDPKLDMGTKSNYVSNSINQALGYATGYGYNGKNGWIGFMRIGKPLDFTKSLDRKDWLNQAEFDYDIRTDDTQWDVTFKKLSNELRKFNPYRVIDFLSRRRKIDENFNMPSVEKIDLDFWRLYENSRIPRRFDRYKIQKAESKEILGKYGIELDPDDLPKMSQDYKDYIKKFYNELSERGFKEGDKSPRPMSLDEFNSLYLKLSEREDLARSVILKNPPEMGRDFDITHGGGDQGGDLTHYIITNRGLIQPISYHNIGSVNPDDYTRRHAGSGERGFSRKQYEEGGEIDEDLSPNEAILRRIANDLSSRSMLAENAAYYSGQDEITAEELANYIGKMSPHKFVMSIGSDNNKLNDFSAKLTTGVLNGDEQAIEDAEILRRMMLETPFNNSNVVIMKDGENILPDPDSLYTPSLLAEYEQGGETVKTRQMYIYKRLKKEAHMDDYQALAVIGNLMGESGLNPDLYGDQNTAYGIQQWRGDRRDRLNKLAREKGEETPSFETQVDYLINEYLAKPGKNGFIYDDKGKTGSGYYNYSRKEFQNASTLRDATVAWNLGSGRPHKNYMRNDERYQFAKQAANNLGIELDEPDENYYSDNGVVQNGFRAPSVKLAQNSTSQESDNSGSSTVKIEEGNIPDRSKSKPSEDMTDFQRSVINELLIQRGLIMDEQVRQQKEADAQRVAEEKQARINEEARRNAIIQSVLQNAKLDIPGMASR